MKAALVVQSIPNWVSGDIRDLVLNENLQDERSHFVFERIAQSPCWPHCSRYSETRCEYSRSHGQLDVEHGQIPVEPGRRLLQFA
jgi:hypothetical protein